MFTTRTLYIAAAVIIAGCQLFTAEAQISRLDKRFNVKPKAVTKPMAHPTSTRKTPATKPATRPEIKPSSPVQQKPLYVTLDGLYDEEIIQLPTWFWEEVKDINAQLKEKLSPSDYLQILKGEALLYKNYTTRDDYLKEVKKYPPEIDNPYTYLSSLDNLKTRLKKIGDNPDDLKLFIRPHFLSEHQIGVKFYPNLVYTRELIEFEDENYIISSEAGDEGGLTPIYHFWDARTLRQTVTYTSSHASLILGRYLQNGESVYVFDARPELVDIPFWSKPIFSMLCIVSPKDKQHQTAYDTKGENVSSARLSRLCGWKGDIENLPHNPPAPWYLSSDERSGRNYLIFKNINNNSYSVVDYESMSSEEIEDVERQERAYQIRLDVDKTMSICGFGENSLRIFFDSLSQNFNVKNDEKEARKIARNAIHSRMLASTPLVAIPGEQVCAPLKEVFMDDASGSYVVFSARYHESDEEGDVGVLGLLIGGRDVYLFPTKDGVLAPEGKLCEYEECIDDQMKIQPVYGVDASQFLKKGAVREGYVGAMGMQEYGVEYSGCQVDGKYVYVTLVTGQVRTVRSGKQWFIIRVNTDDYTYRIIRQGKSPAFVLPPVYDAHNRWIFNPISSCSYQIKAINNEGNETQLAVMYIDPAQGYAIVLPDGRYAGSPDCENFLSYGDGEEVINMSVLAPWRNRPAEVLEAIGGKEDEIAVLRETTKRWLVKQGFDPDHMPAEPALKDFAKAEVEMPKLFTEGESTQFRVKLKASAHDIKKLLVRADGVLIPQSWDDTLEVEAGEEKTVTVEVPLASGQNWIEITPVDSEGISGDTTRFRTIYEGKYPSDMFIVALGVSDYDDPDLKLQYAAKDAKDIAAAFEKYGTGRKHVLVLTDKEVKDRSVLDKVKIFLSAASLEDRIVFYVAGHGMLDDKLNYYYAPAGFDSERTVETGIPMDELIACLHSTQARRRLLLLDTCHSGMLGEEGEDKLAASGVQLPHGVRAIQHRGMKVKKLASPLNMNQKKRYIENVFSRGGTERGINIIAGAAGAEYALESSSWNNGVFTAAIIQALRDAKSDLNGDKKVTVDEIQKIVTQKVSELTADAQKPSSVASEDNSGFIITTVSKL